MTAKDFRPTPKQTQKLTHQNEQCLDTALLSLQMSRIPKPVSKGASVGQTIPQLPNVPLENPYATNATCTSECVSVRVFIYELGTRQFGPMATMHRKRFRVSKASLPASHAPKEYFKELFLFHVFLWCSKLFFFLMPLVTLLRAGKLMSCHQAAVWERP